MQCFQKISLPSLPWRVALLATLCWLLLANHTEAETVISKLQPINIGGGALGSALVELSSQTGVTISYTPEAVEGYQVTAWQEVLSLQDALRRLLQGTGLLYKADIATQSISIYKLPSSLNGEDGSAMMLDAIKVEGLAELSVYEQTRSVGVVAREDIDRMPPRNTADVLRDIPGVMTSNDRQNPGVRVNIRGLEGMGRVNVTIDGARQNYQQTGHTGGSSVYIDPELLSQVSVQMGPNAGVGGAGVIGGVVTFSTLTADDLVGDDETFGGRINATTGTNDYHFSGSLALAAKTAEFDIAAAYSRKDIGEYDVGQNGEASQNGVGGRGDTLSFSDQNQNSELLKLRWRLAENQQLSIGYVGFEASYTDNDTSEEEFSYRNENNIQVDTVTSVYTWQPGDTFWDLEARLWYTRTINDQFRDDRGGVGYGTFDVHYETSTVGGSLENTSVMEAWSDTIGSLNYGIEYFRDWTSPSAVANDGGDPAWFTGATPEGDRFVASAFTDFELVKEKKWSIGVGLRYDWYQITGEGNVYAGTVENGQAYQPFTLDRKADKLAPQLSASLALNPDTTAYINYGEGFRPPMITETLMTGSHPGGFSFPYIPNPSLEEENSKNLELGVNYTPSKFFRSKLTAFYNDIQNFVVGAMVMLPTDINSQNTRFSQVNIKDPVKIYGLEAQGEYEKDAFFIRANATHTQADLGGGRYDPLPLGTIVVNPDFGGLGGGQGLMLNSLPPKLRYSVSGGRRFMDKKIEVGLRMQYVSEREKQHGNVSSSLNSGDWDQDYTLWDIWAHWNVTKDLALRLSGQNLDDLRYVEALSSSNYLAPGRTFMATLSIKF